MTPLEQARAELAAVMDVLEDLHDRRDDIRDSIDKVNLDLSNSLNEFVATTGRPPDDYYPWRKRAKYAVLHKQRALRGVNEEIAKAKMDVRRLQMLLLSYESNYRGADPLELLRATYHLLLGIVEETGVSLDASQVGLISTVRLQCGYDAPGEDDDGR